VVNLEIGASQPSGLQAKTQDKNLIDYADTDNFDKFTHMKIQDRFYKE